VYCIMEDSRGNIWIGTGRRGTWIYDGVNFSEMSWESNSDAYEAMMEQLDDLTLAEVVRARAHEKPVRVMLDEL